VWQGEFNVVETYSPDDVVFHGGQYWKAIDDAGVGESPGESDSWQIYTAVQPSSSLEPTPAPANPVIIDEASADSNVLRWQGEWDAGVSYLLYDVVSYAERSYIAVGLPIQFIEPSVSPDWQLLADGGPVGLQGTDGPRGNPGPAGEQGQKGLDGLNGLPGMQGAIGAPGANGIDGAVGATGAAGIDGVDGAVGATGATGAVGAAGADGAVGATGATGPAGIDGIDGAVGATGATGAVGAAGADGAVGATGATGPAGIDGIDGAVGATGATGAAGADGADGAVGATGATGPAGIDGIDGAVGATGATGAVGADGAVGLQGEKGASWQGDWLSGTSYLVDDIVGLNGTAYIAIQDTTGTESPGNLLYWDIFAQSRNAATLAGGAESGYDFVGFSTGLVDGSVGLSGIKGACQTDFGVESRQASSEDIVNTPQLVSQTGVAWVRAISHPSSRIMDRYSGLSPSTHNCGGWSLNTTATSVVVNGDDHSFSVSQCDTPISVACVAPIDNRGPYIYVGFSTALVLGDVGFKGMNDSCKADYGVDSRLVTSQEIAEAAVFPVETGDAWVMPVPHESSRNVDSVSGLSPSVHACSGFSINNSNSTLIIKGDDHSFGADRCNVLRNVACAVPR